MDACNKHRGPVMCRGCNFENQVRGQWVDGEFQQESDLCAKCEAKAKGAR